MKREKRFYSLWLVPKRNEREFGLLRSWIEEFDKEFNGNERISALFDPHVTLLGSIKVNDDDDVVNNSEGEGVKYDEMIEKCERLAMELKEFNIEFDKPDIGNIYHQSLYILAKKNGGNDHGDDTDSDVILAMKKAREIFLPSNQKHHHHHHHQNHQNHNHQNHQNHNHQKSDLNLMPHLSLLYSNSPSFDRQNETFKQSQTHNIQQRLAFHSLSSFTVSSFELWLTDATDSTCQSWTKIQEFNFNSA